MSFLAGCSKRLSSKAAENAEARLTLRYVELLSDARTKLADLFNNLLVQLAGDDVGLQTASCR